jgi:hypothetical protein
MEFDRAAALATIDKVENKKLKIPALGKDLSGLTALRRALNATASEDFESLVRATQDADGRTDWALAAIVPLPTVGEQVRQGGLLAGRQIIIGDLTVGGALTVTGATFVTGNLKANAVNVTGGGVLVVGGSLVARVVSGDGWVRVKGNVTVDLALGHQRRGELHVGGVLTATLGIMADHGSAIGANATKHWFSFDRGAGQGPAVEADDEEYLALEALLDEKALVVGEGKPEIGLHRVDFRALTRLAALAQPMIRVAGKAGKGASAKTSTSPSKKKKSAKAKVAKKAPAKGKPAKKRRG